MKQRRLRVTGILPYAAVTRMGAWICGSRLAQRTIFRRDADALAPVLALAPAALDTRQALRRHLLAGRLYNVRLLAAARCGPATLRRRFPVAGFDRLAAMLDQGRRVVLISSHLGAARIIPTVLARMGVPIHSIEGRNLLARLHLEVRGLSVAVLHNAFWGRVAVEAQRALARGQVLHVLADGYDGKSGPVLEFLGRWRRFPAGFAELALATNAAVVPVFAPVDDQGRVRIELLDPLDAGSSSLSRTERITGLVQQYARLVEERWRRDPGNVLPNALESFARLPLTRPGDPLEACRQAA